MIALLVKIKNKLVEKGPRGLAIVTLGRIQRTWRKGFFKVVGKCCEQQGIFHKSHFFKTIPVGEIDLKTFPKEDVFKQIQENKYQILEAELRNWGKSNTPGDLIWHKDLVKNYEWSKDILGVDLPIPLNQGDIKRPWEIGRLHQLVQLALCYRAFAANSAEKVESKDLATTILKSFHSENANFNGPQWMCAMDVGIRLANICLAADLFGADFVSENQEILNYELARHIFFIENNLENSLGSVVGNHYYADLCGLILGFAHSKSSKALKRLKTLARLMDVETQRQFSDDGGNFEGSTYYHRLSAELALFSCVCLVEANSADLVRKTTLTQLAGILKFSQAISRADGYVPQIGDNDSGHLFIFNPLSFQKNDLSHSQLIAGIKSFIQSGEQSFASVIKNFLASENLVLLDTKAHSVFGSENDFEKAHSDWQSKKNIRKYSFKISSLNSDSLDFFSFEKFGLFVAKKQSFYICVRCGVNALEEAGGHRHRDQLSIHLFDGTDLVGRDPGSYIYTSDCARRDLFRAAISHNGPYLGSGVRKEKSTFEMQDQWGKCFYFGKLGFFGSSVESGTTFYRWISFTDTQIEIVDWTASDDVLPVVSFKEFYFSDRYGSYKEQSV